MNKKAFTLVELLAVIVILSLIMGLIIPGALKLFGKASNEQYSYYEDIMESSFKLYIKQNEGTTINCASLATLITKKLMKTPPCSGTNEGYVIPNPVYGGTSIYKDLKYIAYFRCTEGTKTYSTGYPSMPTGYEGYRTYNKASHCPSG